MKTKRREVRPRLVEQTGRPGEQFETARVGEDVAEPVGDQRNARLELVEDRPHARSDVDLRLRQPSEAVVGGAFRQVAKLVTLVGVEAQCVGERVDDRDRGVVIAALFDPDEVLDADPRQRCEFRAAQTRDPAPAAGRQAE